jgi:DNA-binding MarR family transcriptional regulator
MQSASDVCDQVVGALRSITRALNLHYKQLLRDYGLSGPQIVVLKSVSASEKHPISEVAKSAHLSHATVTAIVNGLGRKGLIARVQGIEDRREVHISLTEQGIATVGRAPALLHEKFIAEFTALEAWEQNQILSSLQRVAAMIGTSDNPSPMLSVAPLAGEKKSRSRERKS